MYQTTNSIVLQRSAASDAINFLNAITDRTQWRSGQIRQTMNQLRERLKFDSEMEAALRTSKKMSDVKCAMIICKRGSAKNDFIFLWEHAIFQRPPNETVDRSRWNFPSSHQHNHSCHEWSKSAGWYLSPQTGEISFLTSGQCHLTFFSHAPIYRTNRSICSDTLAKMTHLHTTKCF